jgi:sugar-specific transcriptional regulator TrmB
MYTTKELFDLTEKEMDIYRYLLKNPNKNAVQIAVDIKMQRPNVYDLLNNLLAKGLISYSFEGKVKYYLAVGPNKLKDIYEFKKDSLISKEKEVGKIIENLISILILKPIQVLRV